MFAAVREEACAEVPREVGDDVSAEFSFFEREFHPSGNAAEEIDFEQAHLRGFESSAVESVSECGAYCFGTHVDASPFAESCDDAVDSLVEACRFGMHCERLRRHCASLLPP